MAPILEPTPAGCAVAAALVVAGAPVFSAGLGTLRLRRHLVRLAERPLTPDASGLGWVRGRVAIESPLVGPLSGKPCAGFRLEVRGAAGAVVAVLSDRRSFRIVSAGVTARVTGAEQAVWEVAGTHERTLAPGDPASQNLSALLAGSAEATWLRRCGATLTLIERALLAGVECHVIGLVRRARPFELASEGHLARTGTDDAPLTSAGPASREPELWIESDGLTGYLRISDRAPEPRLLASGGWRTLGLLLGPVLSLSGLLYLASAVDHFRSGH